MLAGVADVGPCCMAVMYDGRTADGPSEAGDGISTGILLLGSLGIDFLDKGFARFVGFAKPMRMRRSTDFKKVGVVNEVGVYVWNTLCCFASRRPCSV